MSNPTPKMILTPTELVEPINLDLKLTHPLETVEPIVFDKPITLISPEVTNDKKTK